MSEKREYTIRVDNITLDYDRQTDILYIIFSEKGADEEADESILIGDNIIVRISEGRIIGFTITDFARSIGLD